MQFDFQDPTKDWKIVNSWFVKQTDFWAKFALREIPQPDEKQETVTMTEKQNVEEPATA